MAAWYFEISGKLGTTGSSAKSLHCTRRFRLACRGCLATLRRGIALATCVGGFPNGAPGRTIFARNILFARGSVWHGFDPSRIRSIKGPEHQGSKRIKGSGYGVAFLVDAARSGE
jgi:hypothetical protein